MKEYIQSKIQQAKNELYNVKVSDMALKERIAFEKAKQHIDDVSTLLYKFMSNPQ